MTKRIETSNRKAHIKELLLHNPNCNIYKDDEVITWNISKRQIERYLESIRRSNRELNKLLSIPGKELHKGTYRIPNELKDQLKAYCDSKDLKQQNIVIMALYEYLDKHK